MISILLGESFTFTFEQSQGKEDRGLYSWFFMVPKRNEGLQPILDLRGLNDFIAYKKFRMVTPQWFFLCSMREIG